jgi:hypothetical protein
MKRYTVNPLKMLAILALVIAIIILAPLAVIWALNTLFSMGIAYNIWTWLAVLVLTATFGKANVKVNKDK